jgi:hypothetical protein
MASFDDVVKEMRRLAPGKVTVVSYDSLKFAMDCGIDVWDYAETYSLQAVIRDHGTPEQKIRLQQEIIAGRRATGVRTKQSFSTFVASSG